MPPWPTAASARPIVLATCLAAVPAAHALTYHELLRMIDYRDGHVLRGQYPAVQGAGPSVSTHLDEVPCLPACLHVRCCAYVAQASWRVRALPCNLAALDANLTCTPGCNRLGLQGRCAAGLRDEWPGAAARPRLPGAAALCICTHLPQLECCSMCPWTSSLHPFVPLTPHFSSAAPGSPGRLPRP